MRQQNYPITSSCPFWVMFLYVIILLLSPVSINVVSASGNETDRFSLLQFKESISNDASGVLRSWNDSAHFCNWPGIICSKRHHQRVIALNLDGYNLQGTISPHIGNLSFMRSIQLQNNSFSGEIPQQVGRLFRLQYLNLGYNILEGKIPVNLSYCSRLRELDLGANKLTGIIPPELGSLSKLVLLYLYINNLTGGIPPTLGNISSLSEFSVPYNHIVGTIPDELCRLKSLTFFTVGVNNLSGTIPRCLYNISSMLFLSLTENRFHGTLPHNIGLSLSNIQNLYVALNEFSGTIPESLSNASQLQEFDIAFNDFVGQVPKGWGNLPVISRINFCGNNLGNHSSNSLEFVASLTNSSQMKVLDISQNKFAGFLPHSITNLSARLTHMYLGSNQIHGNIPAALENLVNLIVLGLEKNLFTGGIPNSLTNLKNLQRLFLYSNKLSGRIPSSVGNLTQLSTLNLWGNKLDGAIPPGIAYCQFLQYFILSENNLSGAITKEVFGLPSLLVLDLSLNSLTGSLPMEVGKAKAISTIDLSENKFSGEIPKAVGDCGSLESLDLHGNSLQGTLPSTLASLRGLQYLDLSRNNLTGKIPVNLQKLSFLLYLNLSLNDLVGEVPNNGIFRNSSAISLFGNAKLCGGIPNLKLPPCPIKKSREGKIHGLKLTIVIVCVAAVSISFSSFLILYWRMKSRRKSNPTPSTISFLSEVSYKMLYQATNGFSPIMLLGRGRFGSVYKGVLDHAENPVAVKVLNLQEKGADKSFIAECNALKNIRHRNLVKILTCCSSLDYNGNEFKALVFEFMLNGSLEEWLHPATGGENQSRVLSLIQRLDIAIDVASAIHYLLDHCEQPVLHCDLKPGNILLDEDMIAHVSDFGLARLIPKTTSFSGSQISTIGIKGTIGYVAPEYATGGEPSRQGDIYSYGILILEMFTGKRPTNEMFKDDFNLHNFIKTALPDRLEQVVDSALLSREVDETHSLRRRSVERNNNNINEGIRIDVDEANIDVEDSNFISTHLHKCLVGILEIGLACSGESPNERMNMGDVIKELQHIKNAYLGTGIRGQRRRTNG